MYARFFGLRLLGVMLIGSVGCVSAHSGSGTPGSPHPAARRRALIELSQQGESAIPRLAAALQDEEALIRRTAFWLLREIGPAAAEPIRDATRSADPEIRRLAWVALESFGEEDVDGLETALQDDDATVRREAVRILSQVSPRTDQVDALLRQAGSDPSPQVRAEVLRGIMGEPYGRSVREEAMDRAFDIVRPTPLPEEGWKIRYDPDNEGHIHAWYEDDYDDSAWEDGRIGTAWKEGYVGVGWFRRTFEMPEEFGAAGVELLFEGVDESCWVWVNGRYVGERDIGPTGWDVPFHMDVTDLVRWGEVNQITVRVMNTRMAGGIWRPVILQFIRM